MKSKTNITGFSLVELMVAVVIINLVAMGVFGSIWYAKRSSVGNQEKTIAITIIENRMSELKRTGAENLVLTGDPESGAPSGCASSDCEELTKSSDGLDGLVNTVISEAPDAIGEARIKEVKVEITWTDSKGIPKKEALATYMYGS